MHSHSVNKKVLLRERKRHTARRIATTRCAALSNPDLVWGGCGYPVPGPGWGYPVSGLGGYPVPGPGGVPSPRSGGVPQSQVWGGTPSQVRGEPIPGLGDTPSRPGQGEGCTLGTSLLRPGMEYPLPGPGMGYPPYLDLGWGTPPTWTWDVVPPLPRPEMGTPHLVLRWGIPSPPEMVDKVKTLPSVILRMRAVMKPRRTHTDSEGLVGLLPWGGVFVLAL